jgi:predicted DNA-binding ribbon-helix-helix protein
MSEGHSPRGSETSAQLLQRIREVHAKRGNCTTALRTQIWVRLGGDELDISPANFHRAVARAIVQAGIATKRDTEDLAALLYCLGVTNSNNLFQKVHQGKTEAHGIGRNGRLNSRGRKRTQG